MIPANAEYGVPGADDPAIVADVVSTGAALLPMLAAALDSLDADGGPLLETFSRAHADLAPALVAILAQCYYRDDRVMASLGMEARPPYPGGFEVEDGDWSLLDPVKAREPFYRRVDR